MVTTWKDKLQPARYRGVPFAVVSHELEVGRRASIQEFPQRDEPYVEDLGRRARRFTLQAYIVGDDYMDRRDDLIRACEIRGVGFPHKIGGILVHPYLGKLRVFALSCRIRETVLEGRMCRLSIEFVEAGTNPEPTGTIAAKEATAEIAVQIGDDADALALEELNVSGPQAVRDAIAGELSKVGGTLAGLDVFSGPAGEVALLSKDISALLTDATILATSPANAISTIRQAIDRVLGAVSRLEEATFAYKALGDLDSSSIGGGGSTGLQADSNAAAVIAQVQALALGGLARSLAETEWASRDEALQARAALQARIEALLDTSSSALQGTLARLLTTISKTIPPRGQNLPRILTIELERTTSSLELAYKLYDNPDRDQEIADRNPSVRSPGFLPAGVPLEVLSLG